MFIGFLSAGPPVGLTDNDVGIFGELGVVELAVQQLCGAADAPQGVLNLMRQLTDHLSPGAVLDKQCVFTTDLGASRDVGHLDEQARIAQVERRHPAVNNAFFGIGLGRRQAEFIGIVIAGLQNPAEHIPQLGLVANKTQQGFTSRAKNADAENNLRLKIELAEKGASVTSSTRQESEDKGRKKAEDALAGLSLVEHKTDDDEAGEGGIASFKLPDDDK